MQLPDRQALKLHRRAAGLTVPQVASGSFSAKYLYNVESGSKPVTVWVVQAYEVAIAAANKAPFMLMDKQIGSSPIERVFFGEGPVTVAYPLRAVEGRPDPVLSADDEAARDKLISLLMDLMFQVEKFPIPANGVWTPTGDVAAICGPKSSPVSAAAIETDPYLSFGPDEAGQWTIRERASGSIYESPRDTTGDIASDIAYLGRVDRKTGPMIIIAGIHARGSVGAVDYLTKNLRQLYGEVGTQPFSMVVGSHHAQDGSVRSEVRCPPRTHK